MWCPCFIVLVLTANGQHRFWPVLCLRWQNPGMQETVNEYRSITMFGFAYRCWASLRGWFLGSSWHFRSSQRLSNCTLVETNCPQHRTCVCYWPFFHWTYSRHRENLQNKFAPAKTDMYPEKWCSEDVFRFEMIPSFSTGPPFSGCTTPEN